MWNLAPKPAVIFQTKVSWTPNQFQKVGDILVGLLGDGIVHLWDVHLGREIGRLAHGGQIERFSLSSDGQLIATASDDGTARIWRMRFEDLERIGCRDLRMSYLEENLQKLSEEVLEGESISNTDCAGEEVVRGKSDASP